MRLTRLAVALTLGAALCAPSLMPAAMAQNAATTQNKPVAPPTAPPPMVASPSMTAKPMAMGAPVNINTATEAQLDTVPQIGPKRAASIIKNRPYKSLDELVSKKALSNGIFQKVKMHLTV